LEVTGRVVVEGAEKAKVGGLSVGFAGDRESSARAEVNQDGTFTARLYPGDYQVEVDAGEEKWNVKSIRWESVDVFRKGLVVTDGSRPALEIVLSTDGGKVEGVALDPDDKPAAGATVVLVAESALRARRDAFHACTTDQYGRFHFENIRPGEYKLFAWDDVEANGWFDPELLKQGEATAETVTVQARGQVTSRVHVRR
jgi:hypothetical protein